MEKKPSEEDLDAISKEVGGNWKSLLIHLGVPNTRIEGLLEENNGNPTRACFKGLVFWREGNKPCKPATWSVLLEALEKGAEKREYARDLREEIVAREGKRVQQLTPERFQRKLLQDVVPVSVCVVCLFMLVCACMCVYMCTT